MSAGKKILNVMGEQRSRIIMQASQQVVAETNLSQLSLNMAAARFEEDEGAYVITNAEQRPSAPTVSSYFAYLAQGPSPPTNMVVSNGANQA